jgi:osmotically-inducible protein OsmY
MTDALIRQHIVDELEFEPSIDAANIGVAVENGIVTLTGHLPHFAQKQAIETIVWKVKGVRGLAEEIQVGPGHGHPDADAALARRLADLLSWNSVVPAERIHVQVEKGWVTLTGQVEWRYQRVAAADAAATLHGVVGIENRIEVEPALSSDDIRHRIERALQRNAEIDTDAVTIEVHENTVTLEGNVRTWRQRKEIERAAWSAPGVKAVVDHLMVY